MNRFFLIYINKSIIKEQKVQHVNFRCLIYTAAPL